MESAAEALLIIVSSVLAVFLIVFIIVGIYFISLLRQLKRVALSAENVAHNVEAAAETFGRTAGPLAVIKIISSMIGQVTKSKKRK